MASFLSQRRFYLSKRIAAKSEEEHALSSLWQSKQLAESGGTVLPDTFPHQACLEAIGYVAYEDLVGADSEELELAGLTSRQATQVLAAFAAL